MVIDFCGQPISAYSEVEVTIKIAINAAKLKAETARKRKGDGVKLQTALAADRCSNW